MSQANKNIITNFYTAFSKGNSNEMIQCYHNDVVFEDPAFGTLKNGKPAKMWEMLMTRKKESTTVVFSNIEANETTGKANWTATYEYGPKNRKVINNVSASFKFKDGKIIEHIDSFNLWNWTKQALGISGTLLGWSSFMKNKIQKTTNTQLTDYINKKKTS